MLTRRALLASSPLVLAGCGFQPVYMPSAGDTPGVAQRELAAIYVPIIPDRPGQLLRQALQQRFAGADGAGTPLYNLNVSYWIAGQGLGITPDNVATYLRLTGNANWTLVSHNPPQTPITSGYARVMDDVNIFQNQYFGADLETWAAYQRIAQATADQIALRLAVYFRTQARLQQLS